MLIRPIKKNHKRLREILNQLYGHLDSTALSGEKVIYEHKHLHFILKLFLMVSMPFAEAKSTTLSPTGQL